jgi:Leucine-rich repeat (LRR) protein
MFDVAARQCVPVALVARIISFVDLASHARFRQTASICNVTCQMRAASPAIVCCRAIPMNTKVGVPRELRKRFLETIYKKLHEIHSETYDKGPSEPYLSDSAFELSHILPTTLPLAHSLWRLAPRILDLHHVRLQSSVLETMVRCMPSLQTLCLNARDIPQLTILQDLPNLQRLYLYSIHDDTKFDDLILLTLIERLAFPMTRRLLAHLASPQDVKSVPLPARLVHSQLTHLILWRDPFDADHMMRPVNWTRLLASVPHLRSLTTKLLLPSVSAVLTLVPDLHTLRGRVRERAATIEFARLVPFARHLTVLHYTSMYEDKVVFTQLLNPHTLNELVWTHWLGPHLRPPHLTPMVADLARFPQLRVLRLLGPVYALDAAILEKLCRSLLSLETLALSVLETYDSDREQARQKSEFDMHDDGESFLQPLTLLTRLHTLHFRSISNIATCHLPHLPHLLEYATSTPPIDGHSIHDAFPNLTTLTLTELATDSVLYDLAKLRFLKHLAINKRYVAGISVNDILTFARERYVVGISVSDILTFARARSALAPHANVVTVRVPWCHNCLSGDVELTQGAVTLEIVEGLRGKCVCPPPHNLQYACRHKPHHTRPYSEAEHAEIRAAGEPATMDTTIMASIFVIAIAIIIALW